MELLKPLIYFLLVVTFTRCNYYDSKKALNAVSIQGLTVVDPMLNAEALGILQNRCASCHGSAGVAGINYITDLNKLVSSGLVKPGNSSGSLLYTITRDNIMPPSSPIPGSELNTLQRWIDVGLKITGDLVTNDTYTQTLSFAPGTSSLTVQAVTLLSNKCSYCHNPSSAESTGGGIKSVHHPSYILAMGLAFPGKATRSPLYDAISHGRMPKTGTLLSASDVSLIKQWIDTDLINNQNALAADFVSPLTSTYASLREHIFITRCVLCHGGALGVEEGVNLSTYASVRQVALRSDHVLYNSVQSRDMPKTFPALSTAEVSAIQQWVNAGAP